MGKGTQQYRYVGSVPGQLESGRPLEPGEFVDLSDEDAANPFNKELIDSGKLIEVPATKEGGK